MVYSLYTHKCGATAGRVTKVGTKNKLLIGRKKQKSKISFWRLQGTTICYYYIPWMLSEVQEYVLVAEDNDNHI